MQGAEERRLRRICNTPQGGASEGNTADDILMVDQGRFGLFDTKRYLFYRWMRYLTVSRLLQWLKELTDGCESW